MKVAQGQNKLKLYEVGHRHAKRAPDHVLFNIGASKRALFFQIEISLAVWKCGNQRVNNTGQLQLSDFRNSQICWIFSVSKLYIFFGVEFSILCCENVVVLMLLLGLGKDYIST